MGNETQPTYRFSQAAAAIGITEAALRNWMTRNELDLFGERPKGNWRTFSENDVFVLALAAEIVRFGAPVKQAVEAARIGLGDMNFRTFQGMPTYLYVAPDQLGWDARTDEGLIRSTTGSATVLKIAVSNVLADARRRLDGVA